MIDPCPEDVLPATQTVSPWDAVAFSLLFLFLGWVILDIWLYAKYKDSLSKRVLGWSRKFKWFRWGVLVVGFTMWAWHWIWGFPW